MPTFLYFWSSFSFCPCFLLLGARRRLLKKWGIKCEQKQVNHDNVYIACFYAVFSVYGYFSHLLVIWMTTDKSSKRGLVDYLVYEYDMNYLVTLLSEVICFSFVYFEYLVRAPLSWCLFFPLLYWSCYFIFFPVIL